MALGKKTGGRVAGVPNKATQARQAKIEASGLTPLDYMLTIMRDEAMAPEARFEAAKAAAPYVHPRLASIDNTGEVVRHYVARLPHKAKSTEEWLQEHSAQPTRQ